MTERDPRPDLGWSIGLSSWIIQDGNYGDFATGDRVEAAIEFYLEKAAELAEPAAPSAEHADGGEYEVVGRVVLVEADVWVVDIGISIFEERRPPQGAVAGDTIVGRASLGIDPFFYFERLSERPSMPPLIYTWQINRILRQTAPFIELRPRHFARDPAKLGWEPVSQTNAWADDGGRAEYVLECSLLPWPRAVRENPRSRRASAAPTGERSHAPLLRGARRR